MKKLITLLMATLLVVVAMFSVACGGKNITCGGKNITDIAGTYKLKVMYTDIEQGKVFELGENVDGVGILTEDSYVLKLFDNNTLEFKYTEGNTTTRLEGAWFQDGEYTIGAIVGYDRIYGYINGNNIIFEYSHYGYFSSYIVLEKK